MKYPKNGRFGEFGGQYIPETLVPAIEELEENYLKFKDDRKFKQELDYYLKVYAGRPTPLYYAKNLSEKLGGAKIYLKREDLCHTGAHKVNNTIGQILLAKRLGKNRVIAETGAGQHGVATATVCALMGIECIVYMGALDIKRQAPNVARMKMLGAEVRPAKSGSKTLKDATNEAIRDWINNPINTHYIIGSVVGPHPYPDMVARFQSVISQEIKWQLQDLEGRDYPDHLIACVGGGSNAAGLYYHYLNDQRVNIIAVEAAGKGIDSGKSAATSALGKEGIIHGSKTLLMQDSEGQITETHSISAGLDYPGVGPEHAYYKDTKRVKYHSATDAEVLDAFLTLTRTEGIIPALESAHAISEAMKVAKKGKPSESIVVTLSGRGDKDVEEVQKYLDGVGDILDKSLAYGVIVDK